MAAENGRFDPTDDLLAELVPIVGFRTLKDPTITHGFDSERGEAFVRVRGALTPIPVVDAALNGAGTEGTGVLTWTLRPDDPALHLAMELHVEREIPVEGQMALDRNCPLGLPSALAASTKLSPTQ